MLNIQLVGDQALVAKMNQWPYNVRRELKKEITKQTLGLERYIKNDKLSGGVLHVRTGNLRASIFSQISESDTQITGKVASSGDVKYAAIHEFGGVIHHPGGTPYMAFGGQTYFVSLANAKNLNLPKTKAHDIPIPQRSFMRSSLSERRVEIAAGIEAAAKRGISTR